MAFNGRRSNCLRKAFTRTAPFALAALGPTSQVESCGYGSSTLCGKMDDAQTHDASAREAPTHIIQHEVQIHRARRNPPRPQVSPQVQEIHIQPQPQFVEQAAMPAPQPVPQQPNPQYCQRQVVIVHRTQRPQMSPVPEPAPMPMVQAPQQQQQIPQQQVLHVSTGAPAAVPVVSTQPFPPTTVQVHLGPTSLPAPPPQPSAPVFPVFQPIMQVPVVAQPAAAPHHFVSMQLPRTHGSLLYGGFNGGMDIRIGRKKSKRRSTLSKLRKEIQALKNARWQVAIQGTPQLQDPQMGAYAPEYHVTDGAYTSSSLSSSDSSSVSSDSGNGSSSTNGSTSSGGSSSSGEYSSSYE